MRTVSISILLVLISSCYAWQVINMEEYIKKTQAEITEESLKLKETLDARLPVSSKASSGKVETRTVELVNFSNPIFIIGNDAFSKQWLETNAKKLEEVHAIGFVANIKSTEQLESLQIRTQAPLLPANVDDLMEIFHENHYPLALFGDNLWQ
ncbi:TPA: integrating conjugative element protein [Legionella pneumophila]